MIRIVLFNTKDQTGLKIASHLKKSQENWITAAVKQLQEVSASVDIFRNPLSADQFETLHEQNQLQPSSDKSRQRWEKTELKVQLGKKKRLKAAVSWVRTWPETSAPLSGLPYKADIKDTRFKKAASCLCVSADSLILSLHDSSEFSLSASCTR